MDNLYKILGVANFASLEEIKTAYRKLSKKFHPDVNEGDKFFEEKFKQLQTIYDFLSDSSKKNSYDENLKKHYQILAQIYRTPTKGEPKNSSTTVKRESPFVFHKGGYVRRRRL